MRVISLTFVLTVLLSVNSAFAQEQSCHPISPTDRVIVTLAGGAKIHGTLLCLTDAAAAVLARDGNISETPLSRITRIQTQPDAIWDGAVKGASIPLIFWAILCHGCHAPAGPMLRIAATYGLIGLTWDALQTNQKTIYSGRVSAPTLAWRLRF